MSPSASESWNGFVAVNALVTRKDRPTNFWYGAEGSSTFSSAFTGAIAGTLALGAEKTAIGNQPETFLAAIVPRAKSSGVTASSLIKSPFASDIS